MLKYNINLKETSHGETQLNILNYFVYNIEYDEFDKILVSFLPLSDNDRCNVGELLYITIVNELENDVDDNGPIVDVQSLDAVVKSVNKETGEYNIIAPRYRKLSINMINEVEDDNGKLYWEFFFENGHLFSVFDNISFEIVNGSVNSRRMIIDNLTYVNCKKLLWEVPETKPENFEFIESLIFYGGGSLESKITIERSQTLFEYGWNHDNSTPPTIKVIRPKVKLDIPINIKSDVDILQQHGIDTLFIEQEINKSIPNFIEMEKQVYIPVDSNFNNITKINFNLHFRTHSGENWTVKEEDGWNFTEYGYTMVNDSYYSYNNPNNQSDLLGYLGFSNKDIQYQKNKLQKSFLRLSIFDSTNPVNQNLLGYSTIFFNTNKLYSKYMRCLNLDDWYINEKDISSKYDKISTMFEVNKDKIIGMNDEKIEEYRLSSQMSVSDKYSSHFSSEGFYLYLFADNKTEIPSNLYMKIEFNHAGYGRTIPMMMPYFIKQVDGENIGFKSNNDIRNDWKKDGYGVRRYNEYSYLKLKYLYDKNSNRYIYYIDPETYGEINGQILNINLYEARVKF